MKIIVSTKNISLDGPLESFVQDKIGGLEKFIGGDAVEARVEIGLPSKYHRAGKIYYAEVNLKIGGKLLRATCQHEDLRNAIVDAKNEMQREIKKLKDRKRDLSRVSKK
ncbi:MAG: ribosome-associated translation inhibitor RaiA [Candidatus Colwellbacteria bacterium]|nr:ribosome-associated translation inhibitor RaiA [Candidatus Colwellbacteria bacterium]